jgi:hypothetical protein
MNKINILRIVAAHFDSFRDLSTGKRSVLDFIVFLGAPLAVGALGWYLDWKLYVDTLNAVLAAFVIFSGLLLNLLVLIYTFSADASHPTALARIRVTFVRELHDNIAFAVLVSVAITVVALIAMADLKMIKPEGPVSTGHVMTFLLVYLTINFVLTLLMILKRLHAMLSRELDKPSIRKVS